jgi:hypothetical protein
MPNLGPLVTSRADNNPLFASSVDGFTLEATDFTALTFANYGANAVVTAGTTATYNSKDIVGANKFVFSPTQTGNHIIDFQVANANINWNAGTNSYIKFQIYNITTSSLAADPMYIYSSLPTAILPNSAGVLYLNEHYKYSVIVTVVAVGQNVDLTGAGANAIAMTTYAVQPQNTN